MNKRAKHLLKENERLEQQLTAENDRILTDLVVYLRGSGKSEYQQELVRGDITRMLIEGQARGSTAAEVIGEDCRAFCEQVLAELPPSSQWERALRAAGSCCLCISVLGMTWLFTSLAAAAAGGAPWSPLPVRLGTVVSGALIIAGAAAFVQAVCRTALDEGAAAKKKDRLLMAGLGVIFAASVLCSVFLRQVVFSISPLLALLLIGALFLCSKYIENRVD